MSRQIGLRIAFAMLGSLAILGTALADTIPSQLVKTSKDSLHIGLPKTLFRGFPDNALNLANKPFQRLIQDQIGMPGNVLNAPNAMEMAKQLDAGEIQLGVFHGFEFAWAQARYPQLEPLVVALPMVRDIHVYLVVAANSKITSAADLKGKSVGLPADCKDHILVYWDKVIQTEVGGKKACTVQKSISAKEALEDVIDGQIQATLVDSASFLAFQADRPGRAKKLRILQKSDLFPPAVIAYRKGTMDDDVLKRCREGLIGASNNPRATFMLSLIKLDGFGRLPANYDQQLKKTLQLYPDSAIERISFDKLLGK